MPIDQARGVSGVQRGSNYVVQDPEGFAQDVGHLIKEMGGRTRSGDEIAMSSLLDMDEACFRGISHDPQTGVVTVPIGRDAQSGFSNTVRKYWERNAKDIAITNIVFRYRDEIGI